MVKLMRLTRLKYIVVALLFVLSRVGVLRQHEFDRTIEVEIGPTKMQWPVTGIIVESFKPLNRKAWDNSDSEEKQLQATWAASQAVKARTPLI